jgi:hypothetical protein
VRTTRPTHTFLTTVDGSNYDARTTIGTHVSRDFLPRHSFIAVTLLSPGFLGCGFYPLRQIVVSFVAKPIVHRIQFRQPYLATISLDAESLEVILTGGIFLVVLVLPEMLVFSLARGTYVEKQLDHSAVGTACYFFKGDR